MLVCFADRDDDLKSTLFSAVVIKLEGGSDHDLRTLDLAASSSNTTLENDEPEDEPPKPSTEPKKSSESKVRCSTRQNLPNVLFQRKREGSASDDGAVSDGAEEDEEKKEETVPKAKAQPSSAGESEAKASSNDNETEAGEVPDAPRAFHRTLSIFFRHLAMQTTKDELETVTDRHWT